MMWVQLRMKKNRSNYQKISVFKKNHINIQQVPDKKEIESQIIKLLEVGLIKETSSYAAPVTLVYKKEDGCITHLCVDFRKLNWLVIPGPQPFL